MTLGLKRESNDLLYVQEVVTLQKKYLIYLNQKMRFTPFINYIGYFRLNIIRVQSKIILGHMHSIGYNSSIQYFSPGHYFLTYSMTQCKLYIFAWICCSRSVMPEDTSCLSLSTLLARGIVADPTVVGVISGSV